MPSLATDIVLGLAFFFVAREFGLVTAAVGGAAAGLILWIAQKVTKIDLKFNEKVIASTVKTELVMTGMPGMANHAPMKIPYSSAMGKDGKSMTLMAKRPLTPGTYKVKWSAAGADTHRMGSEFSFTVK